MTMNENARKAFEELQQLGCPVRDWGEDEGYPPGTAFILIAVNTDASEHYFDDSGKFIKEHVVDGKWVNPMGVRQDIHEVLRRHNLVSDLFSSAHRVIYNDPDAAGLPHSSPHMNIYEET